MGTHSRGMVLSLTPKNNLWTAVALEGYQPIESATRIICELHTGAITFYMKDEKGNKQNSFTSHLKCFVYQGNTVENFCALYRSETLEKVESNISEQENQIVILTNDVTEKKFSAKQMYQQRMCNGTLWHSRFCHFDIFRNFAKISNSICDVALSM